MAKIATLVAKFCQAATLVIMSTMNISLPDALRAYVDEQVEGRGFSTASEYVRELIRRDYDRQRLRALLMDGASSAPTGPADSAYFESLRKRIHAPRRKK